MGRVVLALLHKNPTLDGQHSQTNFMEELQDPPDHRPTRYLQRHKNMQFVITLNASINVVNHLNFQWLVVRQTIYSSKFI